VVNSVTQHWDGNAWVTAVVALPTVMSPAAGGASVTWSKGSGWPAGSDLPDGTYSLRAFAYDRVGKSATASTSFKKATQTAAATSALVEFSSGAASVTAQSMSLTFTGALDVNSATTPANYSLSVNTQPAVVKSAQYSAGGSTVTLLLPEGTLKAGSAVTVQWNLRDTAGAIVRGQSTLQAQ
jgi:hypothetical protein